MQSLSHNMLTGPQIVSEVSCAPDQLDKERDHYNLRESNLVKVLIKACLLDPKTSSAAKRAENWRQAGVKNAGQFSNVMEEVVLVHTDCMLAIQTRSVCLAGSASGSLYSWT